MYVHTYMYSEGNRRDPAQEFAVHYGAAESPQQERASSKGAGNPGVYRMCSRYKKKLLNKSEQAQRELEIQVCVCMSVCVFVKVPYGKAREEDFRHINMYIYIYIMLTTNALNLLTNPRYQPPQPHQPTIYIYIYIYILLYQRL